MVQGVKRYTVGNCGAALVLYVRTNRPTLLLAHLGAVSMIPRAEPARSFPITRSNSRNSDHAHYSGGHGTCPPGCAPYRAFGDRLCHAIDCRVGSALAA